MFFISYRCDYEMCCFKRNMSAAKRLIDLKAFCPLSFYLYYHHNGNRRQKNTKSSIKSENCLKSKTLRELEKLGID